jgi:hypothetical protein
MENAYLWFIGGISGYLCHLRGVNIIQHGAAEDIFPSNVDIMAVRLVDVSDIALYINNQEAVVGVFDTAIQRLEELKRRQSRGDRLLIIHESSSFFCYF